jgi:hypothetical protein
MSKSFYEKLTEIDNLMEEINMEETAGELGAAAGKTIRKDIDNLFPSTEHDIKLSVGDQEFTLGPNKNREAQIVATIRHQDEVSLSAITKIKRLIGECNGIQLENVSFIIEQVTDSIDLTAWDVVEKMKIIKENLYKLIKMIEQK